MIKPPLISLMYLTISVNFQIILGLMKSNGCTKIYSNILSPFDIKCKNLILHATQKTSENLF